MLTGPIAEGAYYEREDGSVRRCDRATYVVVFVGGHP